MKAEEFIILVRQLRESQKRYFKTGTPTALAESKDLERRVDKAVQEFYDASKPGLFEK